MYNWSTDEEKLARDKDKYAIWKLEQLANFGLNGEKLKITELRKYWNRLNIEPYRRKFLGLLIYGDQHSNSAPNCHS